MPLLPTTNADHLPVVPMTEDQRYVFDLRGWLCVPAIISEAEAKECAEFVYRLNRDSQSLPSEQRNGYAGPLQKLLDHPVVVGILNEVLAQREDEERTANADADSYGFRLENAFTTIRTHDGKDNWGPHGGGGIFHFPHESHFYQMLPGKIHSGLTRVVWEFNEVGSRDGTTLLLSGSHKAAFRRPSSTNKVGCPLYDTYTCPPGSILVFTEALCHTGTQWKNTTRDRCAVFYGYNHIGAKFHHGGPPASLIAGMPTKRQSLFRGVWNQLGPTPTNRVYTVANHAI